MADCYEPCDNIIDICVNTGPSGPRGSVGKITQFIFYPAVGTTDITGTDKSGTLLEVDPDGVLVALNGVMLEPNADYTIAADGLTVTLTDAIINANDVLTVQTWQSDENASNDVLDLKLDVEKNTADIAGLDIRVSQNEDDIAAMQNTAQNFTTRDIKVSGVSPTRDRGEDLKNQQDINHLFDRDLISQAARLDELEQQQPDTDGSIKDLSDAIEENAQGISDLSTSVDDLTTIVSDNVSDIAALQDEVKNLPDPYDDTEIQSDVDDLVKQVGTNVLAINENTKAIAALGAPVSLEDLEEAVEELDDRVTANESGIKDIKATDAKQQVSINDLEADVAKLQNKTVDTTGFALIDAANEFTKSQSIADGLKITGKKAFLSMDKGSTLEVSNGNFSDAVIDIKRSNGDTAISLEASGHIRGVKTDENDPTSAVNVQFLEDIGAGGGDADLSKYATKLELSEEERLRILGDAELADALSEAIKTEKYNDAELRNKIAAEEKARESGDTNLSNQIKNETQYRQEEDSKLQDQIDSLEIPAVDPSLYATVDYVDSVTADFATEKFVEEAIGAIDFPDGVDLDGYATEEFVTDRIDYATDGLATEEFVTEAIDAIDFPAGTVVGETAPADPEEGATWYDTVRLELFVFAEDAWLPCSPLGARVEAGEVKQAALIAQVDDALEKQLALTTTVNDRSRTQDGLVVTTQLLSDKVDALEGSTLDAKYKADARDNPQVGSFVLQDADGNKVLKFADAKKIELSKTDFTNKAVGLSKVMNGDIIRLVLSPTHYANYTIASVDPKEQTFVFGLTFGSAGAEEVVFDGAVYNFTHATPFDPAAFATIDYVDAQDVKRISLSGENTIDTSWRLKSGNKTIMSGAEEGKIKIYHLAEPTDGDHACTKSYADKMLPRSGTSDLIGDWRVRQENEENNYSTLIHGDNGKLGLYNLKDPGDSHHAVPRSYVDDKNVANAKKNDSNTFKEVNTFQKTAYFQNGIVHANGNADTLTEVRGEYEETKELWHKLRGTCKASWIAYPGQENSGYKRCMTMEWDQESGKPQVFIDYVMDPVNGRHCANKQYVDQKVAEAGGGSFANTGSTTPELSAGELFFNTTDKVLYIGE